MVLWYEWAKTKLLLICSSPPPLCFLCSGCSSKTFKLYSPKEPPNGGSFPPFHPGAMLDRDVGWVWTIHSAIAQPRQEGEGLPEGKDLKYLGSRSFSTPESVYSDKLINSYFCCVFHGSVQFDLVSPQKILSIQLCENALISHSLEMSGGSSKKIKTGRSQVTTRLWSCSDLPIWIVPRHTS